MADASHPSRRAAPSAQAALRAGSSSFHTASLLLPPRVRAPATALYAFCRAADDLVDGGADPARAVAELDARLAALESGRAAAEAVDEGYAAVAGRHRIPYGLVRALVEGFAWDAQGRRYDDLPDLLHYAARVAGSVGVMMALVMGAREPAALARAGDLGVAMQLSNIARDVGEDARAGRLYLPRAWMREEGIDPDAWLRQPVFTPALGRVVARLLAVAQDLYDRSAAGVRLLPLDCRPGIVSARLVYAAIGARVAEQGMDSVGSRAVVGTRRKLLLVARASLGVLPARSGLAEPALDANQFLLDAVAAADAHAHADAPWWRVDRALDARAAWMADLFGRLAREESLAASRPAWR